MRPMTGGLLSSCARDPSSRRMRSRTRQHSTAETELVACCYRGTDGDQVALAQTVPDVSEVGAWQALERLERGSARLYPTQSRQRREPRHHAAEDSRTSRLQARRDEQKPLCAQRHSPPSTSSPSSTQFRDPPGTSNTPESRHRSRHEQQRPHPLPKATVPEPPSDSCRTKHPHKTQDRADRWSPPGQVRLIPVAKSGCLR